MTFKRPPKIRTADEFILGAERSPTPASTPAVASEATGGVVAVTPESAAGGYPWEGRRSDKQTELFNLRLTEVELEKLRFIAANTPDSMQAFIRKALLPAIDRKIDEIIAKL